MRKKRLEITIETTRVFVAGGSGSQAREWCGSCGGQFQMLTMEQAMNVGGMTTRAIYRRIETGEIHFSEKSDGRLLVCLKSLLK